MFGAHQHTCLYVRTLKKVHARTNTHAPACTLLKTFPHLFAQKLPHTHTKGLDVSNSKSNLIYVQCLTSLYRVEKFLQKNKRRCTYICDTRVRCLSTITIGESPRNLKGVTALEALCCISTAY